MMMMMMMMGYNYVVEKRKHLTVCAVY
jgi:TRAP-type C4-dicarboxylate transport system permease small subunit